MVRIRTYLSVILVVMILAGIGWQSATLVHFYANQESIAEEYCVNKSKPELNCEGKCHLKEQLKVESNVEDADNQARINVRGMLVFQGFENVQLIYMDDFIQERTFVSSYFFSIKTSGLSGFLDPPELS